MAQEKLQDMSTLPLVMPPWAGYMQQVNLTSFESDIRYPCVAQMHRRHYEVFDPDNSILRSIGRVCLAVNMMIGAATMRPAHVRLSSSEEDENERWRANLHFQEPLDSLCTRDRGSGKMMILPFGQPVHWLSMYVARSPEKDVVQHEAHFRGKGDEILIPAGADESVMGLVVDVASQAIRGKLDKPRDPGPIIG